METVMINGQAVDFNVIVNLMDDDIRENLHSLGFSNNQQFVDAYVEEHKNKYNEEFIVN